MRHLSSKGFRLRYEQDPRKEYTYGILNLAVDLRNGLRLSKLVELLTGTPLHTPQNPKFPDPAQLSVLHTQIVLLLLEPFLNSVSGVLLLTAEVTGVQTAGSCSAVSRA